MVEYLIASLECMPTVSMKYKKAWFLILVAGRMVVAIDWTGSKAVDITALEIHVSTQMVHGGSWKSIATKMTLVTVKMSISFVWSHFLLGVCHQWRRVMIARCVHFVIIHFHLHIFVILINSLMVACFHVKLLSSVASRWHKQVASCKCICYIQEYVAPTLTFVSLAVFLFSCNRVMFLILAWVRLCIRIPLKDTEQSWRMK